MELNVDLSVLTISAAKMKGLAPFLEAVKEARRSYQEAVELILEYVQDNRGTVNVSPDKMSMQIELAGQSARCYACGTPDQPFDYEMLKAGGKKL